MKYLKYKIPGILVAIMLLLISSGVNGTAVKYCIWFFAIIIGMILAYSTTKDITMSVLKENENKRNEIDKLVNELMESIEKNSSAQSENAKVIIHLIEMLNDLTNQYMEKVSSSIEIQNVIIRQAQSIVEEAKSLNTDVQTILKEFCSGIDDSLNDTFSLLKDHKQKEEEIINSAIDSISKQRALYAENISKTIAKGIDEANKNEKNFEKTVGDLLEDFCSDFSSQQINANEKEMENLIAFKDSIGDYLTRYENALNDAKEALNVMKTQVRVSMEQLNKKIQEQTNAIQDGLDDCSDQISDKLSDFSKKQGDRDNSQNAELNGGIKAIENVLSDQIGQVLEENRKLIEYIQKVQEDWTELSKNEIEFLDKVWNE